MRKRRMKENREPCFSVDFDGGRVVSLDDDALMEILVRLPVKCVTRFKLVCKWWLSLISTDDFKILNFSNGLMLLQWKDYNYNPITNQSKKVSLAHNDMFVHVVSLHLLFDPSESPHYEIVCFRLENERTRRHLVEVFNSGSGTWRVCVQPFTKNAEIKYLADCLRYKSLIFFRDTHSGCVYCFDIVKNDSQLIACPLPNRVANSVYSHSLQESNGSLYYCALLIDDEGKSSAALWKLHVNEDDPRRSDWWSNYEVSVHCFRFPDRSGPILLTFIAETRTVLIHIPEKIVAFNFLDGSYNFLLDLEPNIYSAHVHHFGETLALL